MQTYEEHQITDQIKVRVVPNRWPINPREWDNLSTIATWHKRYSLGDEQPDQDPETFLSMLPDDTKVWKLRMYEHGTIGLKIDEGQPMGYPFNCPWDSGWLGFIYVTPQQQELMGTPDDKILEVITAELNEYKHYVNGHMVAYEIVKTETCNLGHEHETVIEAAGNYPDIDTAMQDGIATFGAIRKAKGN